jgi:hypothetical protein
MPSYLGLLPLHINDGYLSGIGNMLVMAIEMFDDGEYIRLIIGTGRTRLENEARSRKEYSGSEESGHSTAKNISFSTRWSTFNLIVELISPM